MPHPSCLSCRVRVFLPCGTLRAKKGQIGIGQWKRENRGSENPHPRTPQGRAAQEFKVAQRLSNPPTRCHSERSEESLRHGHCHTQNRREILRFASARGLGASAQNDSKRGWRPQDRQGVCVFINAPPSKVAKDGAPATPNSNQKVDHPPIDVLSDHRQDEDPKAL